MNKRIFISYIRFSITFLVLHLCIPHQAIAESPVADIEATYLYHFTRFVKWPSNKLIENQPVLMCMVGDDPVISSLKRIQKELREDANFRVTTKSGNSYIDDCHILFISKNYIRNHSVLLKKVAKSPILTISNSQNFIRLGGIVEFKIDGDEIALKGNLNAMELAGITIHSEVLRLMEFDEE